MSLAQALILGVIQGLTEFLPVSSSGHLVIFEHILNTRLGDISFEVFAHTGTLMAVLVYYRRYIFRLIERILTVSGKDDEGRAGDDKEIPMSWIWYILIGTIPAVIIGLLFKDQIEAAFRSIKLVGVVLILCGFILISTKWASKAMKNITAVDAVLIGIAQALAITPGLSRSGATISTGLFLGKNPVRAADFSFLLSIPAVAGATILKLKDVIESPPLTSEIMTYLIGGLASFAVGFLCIMWLLDIIKKGKFSYFGVYCCLAGLIAVLFIS